MITINDYANSRHLSYETVRLYIKKLENNKLKGHIHQDERVRYIDEYAVDVLDKEIPSAQLYFMERLQESVDAALDKCNKLEKYCMELQHRCDELSTQQLQQLQVIEQLQKEKTMSLSNLFKSLICRIREVIRWVQHNRRNP